MPFDNAKGKMVANKTASKTARSKTAGPNGSFPIGDAKHQRLAIGAAQRSANAGNISQATANSIKSKARKALGEGSSVDQRQDAALRAKTGMSQKQVENSAADRKADAARSSSKPKKCVKCGMSGYGNNCSHCGGRLA